MHRVSELAQLRAEVLKLRAVHEAAETELVCLRHRFERLQEDHDDLRVVFAQQTIENRALKCVCETIGGKEAIATARRKSEQLMIELKDGAGSSGTEGERRLE
jgi:hypothetical protein